MKVFMVRQQREHVGHQFQKAICTNRLNHTRSHKITLGSAMWCRLHVILQPHAQNSSCECRSVTGCMGTATHLLCWE